MKKEMTFKEVQKVIREMDKNLEKDADGFKAACFLLSSAFCGTGLEALRKFTGMDIDYILTMKRRATRNGIFKNGEVHHSGWNDKKTGGIGFFCDVAVLQGFLKRA